MLEPGPSRPPARSRAATPRRWPRARCWTRAATTSPADARHRAVGDQGAAALGRPGRQRGVGGGRGGGGQRAARRRRSTGTRCSMPASSPRRWSRAATLDNIAPSLHRRHRADPLHAARSIVVALPVPAELIVVLVAPRAADAHRRGARRAAGALSRSRSRCTRRPRSAAMVGRARQPATTRCSAARSTTGSPSRRAPALLPGFLRGEGRGARRRRPRQLDLGQRARPPSRSRAGARPASGWRRRWWRPTRRGHRERGAGGPGGPRRRPALDRRRRAAREVPHRRAPTAGRSASPAATRPPSSIRIRAARRAAACSRSSTAPPTLSRAGADRALHRAARTAAGAPRRRACGGFREMVLPSAEEVVSHPEGNTPLLHRQALDRWTGVGAPAAQARGPQSDRLVQGPRHDGRRHAGAADRRDGGGVRVDRQHLRLAGRVRGAGGDLPALVLVPADGVALGKLAQSLAYGARTLLVRGDFDACLRLVEEASTRLGVYLLNSINPFRIEGQKTIVLEMLQQLDWEPPDWIVLPGGQPRQHRGVRQGAARGASLGADLAAAAAGRGAGGRGGAVRPELRGRLRAPARASRRRRWPRPSGSAIRPPTTARCTRSGRPTAWSLAVTDDEILEAKAVVDAAASAASRRARPASPGCASSCGAGSSAPDEHVVAVLTGHILKDPGLLLRYHREQEPPPPARQPADRDRARARARSSGCWPRASASRSARSSRLSSAERTARRPSRPPDPPHGALPLAAWRTSQYLPVGLPSANGANTTR